MLRACLTALFCLFSTVATAQDAPRAILVLDASGSMWGQIDGIAKITIAQDVIGGLLQTLPAEQELGLTAYGHRRKGDCSDIETILAPGTDRAAIAGAVNAIKPKGKTPLSAAVIQAAEALKYTEEAATVILVSDGIETCALDPCEVGRRLEEAGVDFTAHVIGFDVSDPAALAQLQCLAAETGGTFRSAENADELAEALEIVAEPEPAPMPVDVIFRATDGPGGGEITDGLIWNIDTDAAGHLLEADATARPVLSLLPGTGRAGVLRLADEAFADAIFTVTKEAMTVTLVLPEFTPAATLLAPATAPAGSLVAVQWTGPGEKNDYISSADLDMGDAYYHHYDYTRNSVDTGDGDKVMVRMPPKPGSYEIRYLMHEGTKVLARRMIEVTALDITLTAPEQAGISSLVAVDWQGPDYKNDYLTVASLDQGDDYYINYSYTHDGSPLQLQMPPEPGTYEIRYVLNASKHVPARITIEVVDVATSIMGPETAVVGSEIEVTWQGPDEKNDYISISIPGERDGSYEGYTYTREGSPLRLALPTEPGDYELRYILNQDTIVLVRRPITLTDASVTLAAATQANAGAKIPVTWTGPGYKNDYIDIAPAADPDARYVAYTYVRNGSPLQLEMPTEPGDYEIRYIMDGHPNRVMARHAISVTPVSATIEAAAHAPAAGEIPVTWAGPAYDKDYIAIAPLGAGVNEYEAFEYTRDGNPLRLQMPTTPGDYELRYITQGNERAILASRPITVDALDATLSAPESGIAGTEIVVDWTGPDYKRDMITLAQPGMKPSAYAQYERTSNGSPLRLPLPGDPGMYELRYVVRGTDYAILTSQPFEVLPASATLTAPATIAPGANLVVSWTGPDQRGDYIAISLLGDNGHEAYANTSDGSPLIVKVPDRPGAYELRYVLKRDRTIVARQPLTVE